MEITPASAGLLEPYLRHEWMRLKLPAYEEEGGIAAHGVHSDHLNLNVSSLGLRLGHRWQGAAAPTWVEADFAWRKTWGDGRVYSTQYFLSSEQAGRPRRSFTSQGRALTRNAFSLGLEAGFAPSSDTRLSLRYAGLFADGFREHAGWLDLRFSF